MFDTALIESAGIQRREGRLVTTFASLVLHSVALGGLFVAGYYYEEKNKVIETRIEAFLVSNAPAPPPPPPPPPANVSTPKSVKPKVDVPDMPQDTFVTPTKIEELTDVEIDESVVGVEGGVPGGVEGGIVGGVIGGIVGGVIGGTVGGALGGTGTGTGPFRVGQDVKGPVPIHRVEPGFTEEARRERVQGVVILEAIIDAKGDVKNVAILKGLPHGLDQEAITAVKQWKFRPGTRDGKPVPVFFTLTIKFRLD